MSDCIFCKIVNKEAPATILFEDDSCMAISPLDPITKGHALVIPKKHFQDIFDIDFAILAKLVTTTQILARDIIDKKEATGINLLHASGQDAQQSVFHFHIHLIPRRPDDGLDLWIRNNL